MQKLKLMLSCLTLCLLTLTFVFLAQAGTLPQRAFVSAERGNDNNSCTIVAPCRSFNTAINRVQPGGEVVALDSGEYEPVTVLQAVTLEAADGVDATITAQFGQAITIQTGLTDIVVIRGLTLVGQGGASGIVFSLGINSNGGGVLHVENCLISGFQDEGISFAAPGQLFVKDTILRNNADNGIYIIPYLTVYPFFGSATASIDHCRMEKNGTGLHAGVNTKATVRDSIAAGNTGNGFPDNHGDGLSGSYELNVENCVVTGNNNGIEVGSIGRVSNTMVTDNINVGLLNDGGTLISFGNNRVRGNGVDKSGPITVVPQS